MSFGRSVGSPHSATIPSACPSEKIPAFLVTNVSKTCMRDPRHCLKRSGSPSLKSSFLTEEVRRVIPRQVARASSSTFGRASKGPLR